MDKPAAATVRIGSHDVPVLSWPPGIDETDDDRLAAARESLATAGVLVVSANEALLGSLSSSYAAVVRHSDGAPSQDDGDDGALLGGWLDGNAASRATTYRFSVEGPPAHKRHRWPTDTAFRAELHDGAAVGLGRLAARVAALLDGLFGTTAPDDLLAGAVSPGNDLSYCCFRRYRHPGAGGEVTTTKLMNCHQDAELFALVHATQDGLEIMSPAGEYLSVAASVFQAGAVVVLPGESLRIVSAGKVRAVPHRVVDAGGGGARADRLSCVYFCALDSDRAVRPLPELVARGGRAATEKAIEMHERTLRRFSGALLRGRAEY